MRRAAILFGDAEALRESIGVPLPPCIRATYEQVVADTRSALGESEFTAAWAKGRSMAFDQAIDLALATAPV